LLRVVVVEWEVDLVARMGVGILDGGFVLYRFDSRVRLMR
jgi:hypothetical protein